MSLTYPGEVNSLSLYIYECVLLNTHLKPESIRYLSDHSNQASNRYDAPHQFTTGHKINSPVQSWIEFTHVTVYFFNHVNLIF